MAMAASTSTSLSVVGSGLAFPHHHLHPPAPSSTRFRTRFRNNRLFLSSLPRYHSFFLSLFFFCRCFQCPIPPLHYLIRVSLSVKEGGSRFFLAGWDCEGTSLAATLSSTGNPRFCCCNQLVPLAVFRGNAIPISRRLCLELFSTSLVSASLTVNSIVLL